MDQGSGKPCLHLEKFAQRTINPPNSKDPRPPTGRFRYKRHRFRLNGRTFSMQQIFSDAAEALGPPFEARRLCRRTPQGDGHDARHGRIV